MTTQWGIHKWNWTECEECELCERRKKVVLGRGDLPADVLFIGEAPGKVENMKGQAFVGPAGHLLDSIIGHSVERHPDTRIFLTNLVACIPLDENGKKTKEPHKDSILACSERLQEITAIVDPSIIVRVGKLAEEWVPKILPPEYQEEVLQVDITHPAAILRASGSKSIMIQRSIVTIADALDEVFG